MKPDDIPLAAPAVSAALPVPDAGDTGWHDIDEPGRGGVEEPIAASPADRDKGGVRHVNSNPALSPTPARSGLPGWALPAAVVSLLVAALALWLMPAQQTSPSSADAALPTLPEATSPAAKSLAADASPVSPAQAEPNPSAPAAPAEPTAPARPDAMDQAMLERLDRLEARLDAVIAGLREKGYLTRAPEGAEGVLPVDAFVPHPGQAPIPSAIHPSVRAPATRRTQAASAPRAAAPSAQTPRTVSAQLLSVDLWNGQPSVVVSTGLIGNDAVRVLQPGDVYNGVTLKSVDVAAGRATFAIGGRETTLLVAGN